MIDPKILNSKETISKGLTQPFYVIKNALLTEVAEELHDDLSNASAWQHEGEEISRIVTKNAAVKQDSGYEYRRKFISLDTDDAPKSVQRLNKYLNDESILNWVSEVSGRECSFFYGRAALYNTGDNISSHNDHYVQETEDNMIVTRAVTFNYYLTKCWEEEWGGNFIWEKPYSKIKPDFNTLVMFLVGSGSMHHVEPVLPAAEQNRLAITGWFHCVRDPKHLSNELNLDYTKTLE